MQKALLSESLSNFHLSHFILFEIEMQGAKGPLGAPVQKVWCLLGTKGSTDGPARWGRRVLRFVGVCGAEGGGLPLARQ